MDDRTPHLVYDFAIWIASAQALLLSLKVAALGSQPDDMPVDTWKVVAPRVRGSELNPRLAPIFGRLLFTGHDALHLRGVG